MKNMTNMHSLIKSFTCISNSSELYINLSKLNFKYYVENRDVFF